MSLAFLQRLSTEERKQMLREQASIPDAVLQSLIQDGLTMHDIVAIMPLSRWQRWKCRVQTWIVALKCQAPSWYRRKDYVKSLQLLLFAISQEMGSAQDTFAHCRVPHPAVQLAIRRVALALAQGESIDVAIQQPEFPHILHRMIHQSYRRTGDFQGACHKLLQHPELL